MSTNTGAITSANYTYAIICNLLDIPGSYAVIPYVRDNISNKVGATICNKTEL